MPEFAFDLRLSSVARVQADTVRAALAQLAALECFDLGYRDGDVRLTEATVLVDEAECFQAAGRSLEAEECCFCNQPIRFLGGVWKDDGDEHPEICPNRTADRRHQPWKVGECLGCGYAGREDEFLASNDQRKKFGCPRCGSFSLVMGWPVAPS